MNNNNNSGYSITHIYTSFCTPVVLHTHTHTHFAHFIQPYRLCIVCIVCAVIYAIMYTVIEINISHAHSLNQLLLQHQSTHIAHTNILQSHIHQLHAMHRNLTATHADLTYQLHKYKHQINDMQSYMQNRSNSLSMRQIEINIKHRNNQQKKYQQTLYTKKEKDIKESIINNQNEISKLTQKLTYLNYLNSENNQKYKNTMGTSIITSMDLYLQLRQFLFEYMRDDVGFIMVYSMTRDGFDSNIFHRQCDKFANTIILIKTEFNCIFGGFTTELWSSSGFKKDTKAFLFNFNKKKKYPIHLYSSAIYTWHDTMTNFGEFDLKVTKDKQVTSSFPVSYGQGSPKLDLTCGFESSAIEQMEVLIMFEEDLV